MIARLQYISQQNEKSHVENIKEACQAGASWIQLRLKNMQPAEIEAIGKEVRTICTQFNTTFILNDYVEIAAKIEADGVHVGQSDWSAKKARKVLGKEKIIGGTANTFQDIKEHFNNGVDYVGVGPFRYTKSKDNLSPILGLPGYENIISLCKKEGIRIPIIAIGGIKTEDVTNVISTGVHGVAVASLISDAVNKENTIKELLKNLNR